ncbi:hypothetical protein WICMUC_001535 [Wickerhamomyces mucosus]|uniref:Inner centromere protein ARK-binding domain-containing protein n=1 Tax=Wickerhamomyces mucosus TaxID=1378264 RepID=A0A9P8PUC8_9ASCO|nr:hypothetical protein WICMUC_001535 [Wickerhamomyces mucosus]
MSLWSITAAKKKDDAVPGSSTWIRTELFKLHELMAHDFEQFSYSVATEFTWIDEQMEEVLNAKDVNPRLLLESPSKLRGGSSPVKQLRDEAIINLKSPIKTLNKDLSKLSPIRFKASHNATPKKLLSPEKFKIFKPINVYRKEEENSHISKIDHPERDLTLESGKTEEIPVNGESEKISDEIIDLNHQEARVIKEAINPDTRENKLQPTRAKENFNQISISNNDISDNENSFQAIRKSIIHNRNNHDSESSMAKALEEEIQSSSMVVNPSSHDPSNSILAQTSQKSEHASLQEESTSDFKKSQTPPPKAHKESKFLSHRESQGFALLPHRGPLSVKSAKKLPKEKSPQTQNLYSGPDEKSQSPTITKSLYPTLTNNNSSASTVFSPLKKTKGEEELDDDTSPRKQKKLERKEELDTFFKHSPPKVSPEKLKSPEKLISYSHNLDHSPLSTLFATVGSSLRKARQKFIKEASPLNDEEIMGSTAPQLSPSSKVDSKGSLKKSTLPSDVDMSPSKMQGKSVAISNNTEASHSNHSKNTKPPVLDSVTDTTSKRDELHDKSLDDSDEEFRKSTLKFSPVKSIYGSLILNMNKSVPGSPKKKSPKRSPEKTSDQKQNSASQPRSLTRISLSKQTDDSDQQRKSISRTGGLSSIPLELKTAKSRPKVIPVTNDQQIPAKRKPHEDSSTVPIRKVPAKVVAPSVQHAQKVHQAQQDAKRRRTADQLQSVLQKKALRVSNISHLPQKNEIDDKEHDHSHQSYQLQHPKSVNSNLPKSRFNAPSTATLMKTVVLQNALMSSESKEKRTNPFQVPSTNESSASVISRNAKSSTTVLPEIFSESEDDEEGSVLKDWANSPELKNALLSQQRIDPDKVFGPIAPLQMDEIFSQSRASKFRNRGSSAQWTGTDALTMQEIENYKHKVYKK